MGDQNCRLLKYENQFYELIKIGKLKLQSNQNFPLTNESYNIKFSFCINISNHSLIYQSLHDEKLLLE